MGERTPMQWTDGQKRGIQQGETVACPFRRAPKTHNVASEMKDQNSRVELFTGNCWRLRHKEPALLEGDYLAPQTKTDSNVLSYIRRP